MTLKPPVNPNYCATVVTIDKLTPLENCDNVMAFNKFGYQSIVGKDTQVGEVGVLFTAETQLTGEFMKNNNLYRHPEYNLDETKKGYMEDNGRVKAIRFRGHTSNALWLPLSCLNYIGEFSGLNDNDTFDELNGKLICRKYVRPQEYAKVKNSKGQVVKVKSRVDSMFFPQHFSTENWFRNQHVIGDDETLIITQKLHGTSMRVGRCRVNRKLTWKERLCRRLGINVVDTEYDILYGSRKVVKDINNPDQNHFYNEDIWTRTGEKIASSIPNDFVVYGEIIGNTDGGKPIQEGYTYNHGKGICVNSFHVYRVCFINSSGMQVDLCWNDVRDFCRSNNLNHVPELRRVVKKDFDAGDWLDCPFHKVGTQYVDEPIEVDEGKVDEGICIRVENKWGQPQIFKAKSPKFLEHETALLDKKDSVDIEEQQSYDTQNATEEE